MLPALNLFRFYVVDNRFRHPLAVGMLTFASIFVGSSFYFLMRQRRVKRREKRQKKRQQQLRKDYGTSGPILNINDSINDLFQGNTSHAGVFGSKEQRNSKKNNNINGLGPNAAHNNEPLDFFKTFQRIAFIFLTCVIMILFFIVSWFSAGNVNRILSKLFERYFFFF